MMDQERLIRIEKKQDQFSLDMAEVKSDIVKLKVDVTELKVDVAELKSDVAELKVDVAELKSDVAELKSDVAGLKTSVTSINDTLAFMIQAQNERDQRYELNRLEDRRHFEMLMEDQRSLMASFGEGLRAQRTQVEDHEVRIRRLEAS